MRPGVKNFGEDTSSGRELHKEERALRCRYDERMFGVKRPASSTKKATPMNSMDVTRTSDLTLIDRNLAVPYTFNYST